MAPNDKTTQPQTRLPSPSKPVALYASTVEMDGLLHISGQVSTDENGELIRGKVGRDIDAEAGRLAARACGLMVLAQASEALGGLERVTRAIKLSVFVNATEDFNEHPQVANGASHALHEVLGETRGRHSRSAVGVASLPRGVAVEVDAVFKIAPA
jgi:enamine deaminase RidA (YjgF/YER057c/UK114 family)